MKIRLLIIGATGMLGSTLLRYFSGKDDFDAFGTVRTPEALGVFSQQFNCSIFAGVNLENADHLLRVFDQVKPGIVVNCAGIVKQLAESEDALSTIPLNSILPHRLARLCAVNNSRLIHISTDCVFSGKKGGYLECDQPDAHDLYGRSKLLGEVDYPNAVTLRTSIIGHELNGARSLINWFLAQEDRVKGFTEAIFSGLPAVEIAWVIEKFVLPNPHLRGLYHLSAEPISKYDLLKLVSGVYGKQIDVIPDDALVIDRSLNSSRFREATGFIPKAWPEMIQAMHDFG
jgi:dTDP-4-dehydrorhamnose reductase